MRCQSIQTAVTVIRQGGLLVYPTEGVYGLGCDYQSQQAVERLLQLKQRTLDKGLILIASHIQQILPLIQLDNQQHLARALKTWPGHQTWTFKPDAKVPAWISGAFNTVAVRVSAHPTVKAICDELQQPMISTSANRSGQNEAKNLNQIIATFGSSINCYLDLPLGNAAASSSIKVAQTGEQLR